jgi:hypothetical protein
VSILGEENISFPDDLRRAHPVSYPVSPSEVKNVWTYTSTVPLHENVFKIRGIQSGDYEDYVV